MNRKDFNQILSESSNFLYFTVYVHLLLAWILTDFKMIKNGVLCWEGKRSQDIESAPKLVSFFFLKNKFIRIILIIINLIFKKIW